MKRCPTCNQEDNGEPLDPFLMLTLSIYEDDRVAIWNRERRSTAELVRLLRAVADGFENDDAKQVG